MNVAYSYVFTEMPNAMSSYGNYYSSMTITYFAFILANLKIATSYITNAVLAVHSI